MLMIPLILLTQKLARKKLFLAPEIFVLEHGSKPLSNLPSTISVQHFKVQSAFICIIYFHFQTTKSNGDYRSPSIHLRSILPSHKFFKYPSTINLRKNNAIINCILFIRN